MLTIVPDATACVVERLGRYHRTLLAGMHFLVPVIDRVAHRFSLRPQDRDLSDRCITFDNVPVSISSRVRWQILDPERAAYCRGREGDGPHRARRR